MSLDRIQNITKIIIDINWESNNKFIALSRLVFLPKRKYDDEIINTKFPIVPPKWKKCKIKGLISKVGA